METELKRCLTTFDLVILGFSNTVGGGIYVALGLLVGQIAGPATIISFFLAAIPHMLTGLCLAEFGCKIPKAGSIYLYLYMSVGELIAFISGWTLIINHIFEAGLACRGITGYINGISDESLDSTLPEFFVKHNLDPYSVIVVLLVAVTASVGIKQSTLVSTILWSVNISTLLFVSLCGFVLFDFQNWANFFPFGISSVFKSTTKTYFAFTGYDLITISSEEAFEPSKSVPVALITQISLVAVLYCTVSISVTLITPYYEISETAPFISVFGFHNLKWAEYIVTVGALCSLIGLIMGRVLCFSRTMYAISQDGLFMRILSKVNKTTQVPVFSTVIGSVLIGLVAIFLSLDHLTELVSFGNVVNHTLLAFAIIVVRYTDKPLLLEDAKQTNIDHKPHFQSETEPLTLNKNNSGWTSKKVKILAAFVISSVSAVLFIQPVYIFDGSRAIRYVCLICFVSFSLLSLGVIVYFGKKYKQQAPSSGLFRTPLVPLLPAVSIWMNLCIMAHFGTQYLLFGLFWASLGAFVYFVYGISHSNLENDASYPLEPKIEETED
ncbi:cationic amino acid transporter 4-like isoform X2 [Convolutriloba macropyga]